MRPAIFLDRDGVLIENRSEYVRDLRDVEFLPGTFEALRCAAALPREFALVIVSNQAGVGKGVITAEAAEAIQAFVVGEIASHGGRIDRAYFCPHRADENCGCRKPRPGMLLQAARELDFCTCRKCQVRGALCAVRQVVADFVVYDAIAKLYVT